MSGIRCVYDREIQLITHLGGWDLWSGIGSRRKTAGQWYDGKCWLPGWKEPVLCSFCLHYFIFWPDMVFGGIGRAGSIPPDYSACREGRLSEAFAGKCLWQPEDGSKERVWSSSGEYSCFVHFGNIGKYAGRGRKTKIDRRTERHLHHRNPVSVRKWQIFADKRNKNEGISWKCEPDAVI